MKVCIVLGTRPELIKFTPITEALQRKPSIELCVINTGQHTTLLDVLPHVEFKENLRWQPYGSLSSNLADMLTQLNMVLTRNSPDLVLVQGDTTSALAGALAAANLQIKIGHVEAGLRTYDKASPFPEENNRRLITAIADYHFCISDSSVNNVVLERASGDKWLTGSTAIDMVQRQTPPTWIGPGTKKTILLTLHRRENLETDRALHYLKELIRFLNNHATEVNCLWVIHPNPRVTALIDKLDMPNNMGITDAADHTRFISYCRWAWVICSDSGGIQEENTVLKRPLFILRDTTERPEVLDTPNVVLVHQPESLGTWLHDLNVRPERYKALDGEDTTFGQGNAGQRIADIIEGLHANTGI